MSTSAIAEPLRHAGAPVTLIWHDAVESFTMSATVEGDSPWTVQTRDPRVFALPQTGSLTILAETEQDTFRVEAQILRCKRSGDRFHVQLNPLDCESLEKRAYPRYDLELPVQMRSLGEENNSLSFREYSAKTRDISQGGMFISGVNGLNRGWLVRFHLDLGTSGPASGLGLIARVTEEGVGVEFIDWFGHSESDIVRFLTRSHK